MRDLQSRIETMEAQLVAWARRLDALVVDPGMRDLERSRASIDELILRLERAQKMMDALRAGGPEDWRALQALLDSEWQALEDAFAQLSE